MSAATSTSVADAERDGEPGGGPATCLRGRDGTVIPLDVGGWSAPADEVEHRQLADVQGPVLDIGCGPGRLVVALAERGIPALGVDASPEAVSQAIERRAAALVRSVFDPIPGTGRWATALLFDGNVGIGGDPVRLLTRVGELLARDGRALVETGAPGTASRSLPVRVERGEAVSDWFIWAQVGADDIADVADAAGLRQVDLIDDDGRWFAALEPWGPR
ncbi:methyltransferase domain-containing protein [Aquihabitans sp. McL0605]|uniref:methyltransferase domain-containing protein n=1 Tax=Aquihabitans sp. McL0605 TaxID=3415671 RepID=UPI003CE97463